MSSQFWVGALVPPVVKWVQPRLKRFFKLDEFNNETRARVSSKTYPAYYAYLYGLWILTLIASGIIAFLLLLIFGQNLFPGKDNLKIFGIAFINMFGMWFIFGAILDTIFWTISSNNFRDYVIFRQIKTGWGFDIRQQIITLLIIGLVYYLTTIPIMVTLLVV